MVVVLLVTVLMRVAIVAAVVYLLLQRGPLCPHCDVAMLPIRNRLVRWLFPALEQRWCMDCGWNGLVRRGAPASTRTETRRAVPRAG